LKSTQPIDPDSLVQPQGEIGPNYAGKMILRGMFIHVPQKWFDDSVIGRELDDYLDNRKGEVGTVILPRGEQDYPKAGAKEIKFIKDLIAALKKQEEDPTLMTEEDIAKQVGETDDVVQQHIDKYKKLFKSGEVTPLDMAIFKAHTIRGNVKDREITTHDRALDWPKRSLPSEVDLSYAGDLPDESRAETSSTGGILKKLFGGKPKTIKEMTAAEKLDAETYRYAGNLDDVDPRYRPEKSDYMPPAHVPATGEVMPAAEDNTEGDEPEFNSVRP
jgi:hypothetical protein